MIGTKGTRLRSPLLSARGLGAWSRGTWGAWVRCALVLGPIGLGTTACSDEETQRAPSSDGWLANPSDDDRPDGVRPCRSELSSEHPATLGFWKTFGAMDRAARNDAIASLDEAAKEHPLESELHLLLGLAHLWRLAEPLANEASDTMVLAESGFGSKEHLEEAYALCPTDHRIPAWLGPVLFNMGEALGDDDMVKAGLAVLDQGIAHYPAFVLFSKMLVFADRPANDAEFQNALEAVRDNVSACSLGTAPEGKLSLSFDPACNNTPLVQHNVEGSGLFLGDLFAKAGLGSEARATVESSGLAPNYASWGFDAVRAERLATIDARIAAFATESLDDDPEVAWRSPLQCAYCHAE